MRPSCDTHNTSAGSGDTLAMVMSALLPLFALLLPALLPAPANVIVVVDMDVALPGIQSSVTVPPTQAAVYLFDPLGTRTLWGMGYIRGLDRGIAFGHVPGIQNFGAVGSLIPAAFGRGTLIAYDLAERSAVHLAVHDATGRLIRVLVEEPGMSPGRHVTSWDGRDIRGKEMPAGVYFYRLDAGGRWMTRRVVRAW